jgi:hypothetical protein
VGRFMPIRLIICGETKAYKTNSLWGGLGL